MLQDRKQCEIIGNQPPEAEQPSASNSHLSPTKQNVNSIKSREPLSSPRPSSFSDSVIQNILKRRFFITTNNRRLSWNFNKRKQKRILHPATAAIARANVSNVATRSLHSTATVQDVEVCNLEYVVSNLISFLLCSLETCSCDSHDRLDLRNNRYSSEQTKQNFFSKHLKQLLFAQFQKRTVARRYKAVSIPSRRANQQQKATTKNNRNIVTVSEITTVHTLQQPAEIIANVSRWFILQLVDVAKCLNSLIIDELDVISDRMYTDFNRRNSQLVPFRSTSFLKSHSWRVDNPNLSLTGIESLKLQNLHKMLEELLKVLSILLDIIVISIMPYTFVAMINGNQQNFYNENGSNCTSMQRRLSNRLYFSRKPTITSVQFPKPKKRSRSLSAALRRLGSSDLKQKGRQFFSSSSSKIVKRTSPTIDLVVGDKPIKPTDHSTFSATCEKRQNPNSQEEVWQDVKAEPDQECKSHLRCQTSQIGSQSKSHAATRVFTKTKSLYIPQTLSLAWLVSMIENTIIFGSRNARGIWHSGFMLRLAICQILSQRPRLALSCLTQSINAYECRGLFSASSLLKTHLRQKTSNENCVPESQQQQNVHCGKKATCPANTVENTNGSESETEPTPIISPFQPSISFLYLLKVKLLINQMQEFREAIQCSSQWLEEYTRNKTLSIALDPNDQSLLGRIHHLLGVALIGYSLEFLPDSIARTDLLDEALIHLHTAVKYIKHCWKIFYHIALALTHKRHYEEAMENCQTSIAKYSGYPGAWMLQSALTCIIHSEHGNEAVPVAWDRKLSALASICVIKEGLCECPRSPGLLFCLFITLIQGSHLSGDLHKCFAIRKLKESVQQRQITIPIPPLLATLGSDFNESLEDIDLATSQKLHELTSSSLHPSTIESVPIKDSNVLGEVVTTLKHLLKALLYAPKGSIIKQTIDDKDAEALQHDNDRNRKERIELSFQSSHELDAIPITSVLAEFDDLTDKQLLDVLKCPSIDSSKKRFSKKKTLVDTNIEKPKSATTQDDILDSAAAVSFLEQLSLTGLLRQELGTTNVNSSDYQTHSATAYVNATALCVYPSPCDSFVFSEDQIPLISVFFKATELFCETGCLQLAEQMLRRAERIILLLQSHTSYVPDSTTYEALCLYIVFCNLMRSIEKEEGTTLSNELISQLLTLKTSLSKFIALAPSHKLALQMEAALCLVIDDPGSALVPLERCLVFDGSDERTMRLLGETQASIGRLDDAFTSLEKLTALEKKWTPFHYECLPVYYL